MYNIISRCLSYSPLCLLPSPPQKRQDLIISAASAKTATPAVLIVQPLPHGLHVNNLIIPFSPSTAGCSTAKRQKPRPICSSCRHWTVKPPGIYKLICNTTLPCFYKWEATFVQTWSFLAINLEGWGAGGARIKTRYIIIYLGGKKTSVSYFRGVLIGIWIISQPGEVCILMWFGHISYPQFSSFHCSKILQNFVSFRK